MTSTAFEAAIPPETALPPESQLRPDLKRIISAGRRVENQGAGSVRLSMLLIGMSLIALWSCFTPLELAPVAWFALVPLAMLVRVRTLPRGCYTVLAVFGFGWAFVTLQWMRLGHPTMYAALAALSVYIGLYFPVFVLLSRRMMVAGVPLWLSIPAAWTGLEFVRAYLLTGFSWYYLGHSQYRWLALIQICDLIGAYGVSFLVAMSSGVIAALIPASVSSRLGLDSNELRPRSAKATVSATVLPVSVLLCSVVASCVYGTIRLNQSARFNQSQAASSTNSRDADLLAESAGAGPTFALIQGNFTPEVKHDPGNWKIRFQVHNRLTRDCVHLQPHFIVWPEGMYPWPDQTVEDGMTDKELIAKLPGQLLAQSGLDSNDIAAVWRNHLTRQALSDHAREVGTALIVGLDAHEVTRHGLQVFNATAFVRPDLGFTGRYDKMHRVVFGEYLPLKDLFPWLSNLTPFGPHYGIDAGAQVRMFEYGRYRVAPLICYEDTVPQVVRRIASQRAEDGSAPDVLVNLTNDAWFRGSSELDQHLITATFRAIENRIPLVRAVNGGISGFIDGDGRIREPDQILAMKNDTVEGFDPDLLPLKGMRDPATGRWRRQFSGIVFGQVPLDPRESLYQRFGDWFAVLCAALVSLACGKSLFRQPKV